MLRIPDPDYHPSWRPDPTTATKETMGKKFVVLTFLVAINITEIELHDISTGAGTEKNLSQFTKECNMGTIFYPKNCQ